MPRSTRTFIALPIPGPLKAQLERFQKSIAPEVPEARWVEPSGFHLTLAFLGDVEDTDLNVVCGAVAGAVRDLPRFDLSIQGVGAFPDPSRPRVLWAGIAGDLDALAEIRDAAVVAATGAGYRPEDDRFHPHITLAYIKAPRGDLPNLRSLIDRRSRFRPGGFAAEAVITYASTNGPEGPAYVPLATSPLAKRPRA